MHFTGQVEQKENVQCLKTITTDSPVIGGIFFFNSLRKSIIIFRSGSLMGPNFQSKAYLAIAPSKLCDFFANTRPFTTWQNSDQCDWMLKTIHVMSVPVFPWLYFVLALSNSSSAEQLISQSNIKYSNFSPILRLLHSVNLYILSEFLIVGFQQWWCCW